jgi:selenide,water dikinase
MLEGVWDKVREAGAVIAGGHTTKDMELKCGLAVTGLVHPDRVLTNARARPGDALILTKPLGSGIIATALRAKLALPESVRQANAVMTELNRQAAAVANEVGALAATDITGFGLLGHAWEMAEASKVDLAFQASAVPLLPGVRELARQQLFPGGSVKNFEFMKTRADFAAAIPDELRMLLCDAQTSGGLLLAVAGDQAGEAVSRLHAAGVAQAARIGTAHKGSGRLHVLR